MYHCTASASLRVSLGFSSILVWGDPKGFAGGFVKDHFVRIHAI
jgi:hypothetical protein